ncbi:MAG: hypothetical protein ACYCS7_06205 [Acidimicrobiales bacterium]
MRKLIVLLVVLGVLVVGANLAARTIADDELAQRAQIATGSSSASARVGPFPLLYYLILRSTAPRVDVRLRNLETGLLRLQQVDVNLTDVYIDRANLLDERRVVVTGIARVTAEVTVTAGALSAVLGHPVTLAGSGEIKVELPEGTVAATAAIVDGHTLSISTAGVTLLSVDLAQNPLVPACAMALTIRAGIAQVSCHMQPVPNQVLGRR